MQISYLTDDESELPRCVSSRTPTHTHTHTHTRTRICANTHTKSLLACCTCACVHVCVCMHTSVLRRAVCTSMHSAEGSAKTVQNKSMGTCCHTHTNMHTCTPGYYTHTHAHNHTHTHTHTHSSCTAAECFRFTTIFLLSSLLKGSPWTHPLSVSPLSSLSAPLQPVSLRSSPPSP